MTAKPIHSMIRVLDEARSTEFYRRAFGFEPAGRFEFDGFSLVYLRSPDSPFELELTINTGRSEPYSLGDGYGHIAVSVDDLDAAHTRLDREGLSPGPLREMKHDGKTLARFFFVQDPDGYRVEVLQRHGRYI